MGQTHSMRLRLYLCHWMSILDVITTLCPLTFESGGTEGLSVPPSVRHGAGQKLKQSHICSLLNLFQLGSSSSVKKVQLIWARQSSSPSVLQTCKGHLKDSCVSVLCLSSLLWKTCSSSQSLTRAFKKPKCQTTPLLQFERLSLSCCLFHSYSDGGGGGGGGGGSVLWQPG